jgi:hypothetical protein
VTQSADAPPNGTVAGAVQAILLDPALSPNTVFICSPTAACGARPFSIGFGQ